MAIVNVIINEQHTLLPEQVSLLKEIAGVCGEVYYIKVPAEGWNEEEIYAQGSELFKKMTMGEQVIFASPIPLLICNLAWLAGEYTGKGAGLCISPQVFHNDHREKKELPNGKIIQTVAKTGWVIR